MKPFVVNKNSWHYKMNIEMVQTNDRLKLSDNAEKFVQSKDNFCSYWRMTLWSMFKIAIVAVIVLIGVAFVLSLICLYGFALIFNTKEVLLLTGGGILAIAAFFGLILLGVWLDSRKRAKLNRILHDGETETSLARAKYSSWKNGVCLPVEFKE
jgi:hypothetical protein